MMSNTWTATAAVGQIRKTVLTPGQGLHTPNEGSKCTVTIGVTSVPPGFDVKCFDFGMATPDEPWEIVLGSWETYHGQALELVIEGMKVGETCSAAFRCQPQKQDKTSAAEAKDTETDTAEKSEVVIELTLKNFEPGSDAWKLPPEELYSTASKLKAQGTSLYQKGHLDLAFIKFSRALKYLICMGRDQDIPEDLLADARKLKCQCYLNLSAAQLVHNNHSAVIHNCTEALSIEPCNVKGLYRRAQAYIHLKLWDSAHQDLLQASTVEPENKAVQKYLAHVKSVLKKQDGQIASAMSKLFQ